MIRSIIKTQLKYSWYIVLIFFMFLGVALTFIPDFTINPSLSDLVSETSEFNTNERLLANTFPTNNVFAVVIEPDEKATFSDRITDMNDERIREYYDELSRKIIQNQYVERTGSLEINEEGTFARVTLFVSVPRNVRGFQEVTDDLNLYMEEIGSPPGVKASLSGFSILLTRVNTFLVNDNLKSIGFTALAIFIVLFWYFRNMRMVLITLSIPLISLVILGGIMAALSIHLTITLAAVGVLILALGIDYAIHMAIGFEKNCGTGKSKEEAIIESTTNLSKAIIASYITTLAGFSALMFGISPGSQSQGLVLGIGITIIFVTTMLLLPPLMYLFSGRTCPVENEAIKKIKRRLLILAKAQTLFPKTVLLAVFVVTLVMAFGATKIQFSTSNNNWIPDDDPVAESFRKESAAFGDDISSMTVVIKSTEKDLRNVQTAKDIQRISNILKSSKDIINVVTPYDGLILNQAELTKAFSQPPLKEQFNNDYTLTTMRIEVVSFASDESGNSPVFEEIKEVFDKNPIYFAEVSYFGDILRFRELGESLGRDTGVTTAIAFIFVFILSAVAYASFSTGFIALLPVIVGIVWTVGLMGYLNVPFTSLSTGLIALVLGIGVDFSIHLVNSTLNSLNKGKSLLKAIENTIQYTGTPIILSSITTFFGFISLLLGTLLGVQRLGMSLALSILSVFAVTIIMVPAILSLTQKNKVQTSKQLE